MWCATFATTPRQARLDRLAFDLLLAECHRTSAADPDAPEPGAVLGPVKERPGNDICVVNDLSDGHP